MIFFLILCGEGPRVPSVQHTFISLSVLVNFLILLTFHFPLLLDVYYTENWPCPCVNGGFSACNANSKSKPVTVPSYVKNITRMARNQWYSVRLSFLY